MDSCLDSGELGKRIIDGLPDALVVVDSAGRVAGVNVQSLELLGYTEAELLGQPVELLVPERLRERHRLMRSAFDKVPSRRPMAEGRELWARRRDGSEISVQIALSRVETSSGPLVLVVLRETPDHVRAIARALHELEMVLECLPDPVAIRIDDSFAYVNSAWLRVLGYGSANELFGRPFLESVHPEDRAAMVERMQGVERAGESNARELRLLAKDGSVVALDVPKAIALTYRGQHAALVVAHDVREQKRLEAALALGERLATVGTLAAGVGHELNNPLQYVSMNLELLRDELQRSAGGSPSNRFRDLLALITDALSGAESIRKIVLGLRTFARGERAELVELDLTTVLELSFNLTRNELRHRMTLETDFEPTPRILADESRLAQVFINILMNAAQAMAGRPADQNVLRVSTWTDARGWAVVELRDNGPGMSDAVRSRIFEPFFTTKPVGKGTGLGLSIAYNIVTALGGQIECESWPGTGTAFRIALPVSSQTARPASGARRLEPAARRARILVVEDEPVVASLLERVLKSDHDVDMAADGFEALSLLTTDNDYDLVLCDLMMPNLTGQELYSRVTRERPQLARRFVFMTGGTTSEAAEAFLAAIPNEKLYKPFTVPVLRSVVSHSLQLQLLSATGSR